MSSYTPLHGTETESHELVLETRSWIPVSCCLSAPTATVSGAEFSGLKLMSLCERGTKMEKWWVFLGN